MQYQLKILPIKQGHFFSLHWPERAPYPRCNFRLLSRSLQVWDQNFQQRAK
jgi:hypothetical protein